MPRNNQATKDNHGPRFDTARTWATRPTDYILTDHLGTTRGLTLPNGTPTDAVTFTAFGERIGGADHRFGYVGQFGYQAHTEMPYLHVGARYYDPVSGRFLQRDPIGILGGFNVFAYAALVPTVEIDPDGLELPPAAGTVGEVGKVIIEGGEVVGGGAESSVRDAPRRHIVKAHPGLSGKERVKNCPICKRLDFAERRRKARERNKQNYPSFCMPWNWGLNRWYE